MRGPSGLRRAFELRHAAGCVVSLLIAAACGGGDDASSSGVLGRDAGADTGGRSSGAGGAPPGTGGRIDAALGDSSSGGAPRDASTGGASDGPARDADDTDHPDAVSVDASGDRTPNDGPSDADGPCIEYPESGSCTPCPTPLVTCDSIDTSPAAKAVLVDEVSGVVTISMKSISRTAALDSASVTLRDCGVGIAVGVYTAVASEHSIAFTVPSNLISVLSNCAELDYEVKDRCGRASSFSVVLFRDSRGHALQCPTVRG